MTSIFISHSHSDQLLAEALVEYVLSSLNVTPKDVRCTSVSGHQLAFGKTVAEQLKADIQSSSAVLILLTKHALESKWVMFELGASWALGTVVVPILATGVGLDALPGPLAAYPSVAVDLADASSRMADAIAQIASRLNLTEQTGGRRERKLQTFLEAARTKQATPLSPGSSGNAGDKSTDVKKETFKRETKYRLSALEKCIAERWTVHQELDGQSPKTSALDPNFKQYSLSGLIAGGWDVDKLNECTHSLDALGRLQSEADRKDDAIVASGHKALMTIRRALGF
jgi:hypothetical protein